MSIKYIQLLPCTLEAFLNTTDVSFDVAGFIYNDGVTTVAPTDIGDVCYATIEPNTERAELVSFTIGSVTAAGVATLTVTRGLSQKSPYGTGGATFTHQAGSNFVISNNPGLLNHFAAKDNDEAITGDWTVPTPAGVNSVTPKTYVDTLDGANVKKTGAQTVAGVKTFNSLPKVPTDTPTDNAEVISKSHLDSVAVTKTGDQTIAGVKTFSSAPKVPDATAADEPMTKGQHDADVSAASAVASPTVRGSAKLDIVADAPLDPEVLTATADRVAAIGGANTTPGVGNEFVTKNDLSDDTFLFPRVTTFTAPGTWTWTKNAGLKYVVVELVGPGGGAEGNGTTTPQGSDGTSTSFGAHLSATGGEGGGKSGSPGVGSGGDINTYGGSSNEVLQTSNTDNSSPGGSSHFDGGGRINFSGTGYAGLYGSGGGASNHFIAGGTSNRYAQGGHAGGYSRKVILASALGATETVTVGAGGAGGAAGTNGVSGGAGGNGFVTITEYYS